MSLRMDPEILSALSSSGPMRQAGPAVGDVESRRRNLANGFDAITAPADRFPGVERSDVSILAGDGDEIQLSWYRQAATAPPGSAVLYLHGGGFIVPLLPAYDSVMRAYTTTTGVPILLVD